MAARRRMEQVKTAVLSLLLDAYQRRDKVGLVTFRGDGAEVALPPTHSVDIAARRLAADLIDEAVKVAEKIAGMSRPAVLMAKESVNRAYETTLAEGVRFERRLFQSMFATEDQKEGMAAFVEKRQPAFRHR